MDNQTQTQKSTNRSLSDMNNNELLQFIWQGLNNANTKGSFSIDEAFTLRLVYDKLRENITEKEKQSSATEAEAETNSNINV